MSRKILEALGVACELTNTTLSEGALQVIAEECARYPEAQILGALRACCRKLKGKLTIAEILSRIDDGRPDVERAWAEIASAMASESRTIVWSDEMREAYGVAQMLREDPIAARMAFKEQYLKLVDQSREASQPPVWSVSLGSDKLDRERAIVDGVKNGRLMPAYAHRLLPYPEDPAAGVFLEQFFPRLLE